MKAKLFLLFTICSFGYSTAQTINFTSPFFRSKLVSASPTNTIAKNLAGNYFKIDVNNNNQIEVSEALQVKELNITTGSSISSLVGISYFTNLQVLTFTNNTVYDVDLSALTNLRRLRMSSTLHTFNFTGLNLLYELDLRGNYLENLDLTMLPALITLDCSSSNVWSLNVNGLTHLTDIICYWNAISNLNLSNLPSLQRLDCQQNQMDTLSLSNLPALNDLQCGYNNLTTLSLINLPALQSVVAESNDLQNVTLNGLPSIETLNFDYNLLQNVLDVSNLTNLKNLYCNNNGLSSVNVANLPNLQKLYCNQNGITSINLTGLTGLQELFMYNNNLTALNVSNLTSLQKLSIFSNYITTLTLVNLPALQLLDCYYNQIPTLNLTNLPNLQTLNCYSNQLTTLDFNGLTNLQTLDCSTNYGMTSINLSPLVNLRNLSLRGLPIHNLDLTGLTLIENFELVNTFVADLDCSGFVNPLIITCNYGTWLNSLNVKCGGNPTITFSGCNLLEYICANDNQIADIQAKITQYGYTNCYVNSYCSFSPGGTFYTIQGNSRYDSNTNGCDGSDINFPNLKLSFTNGTTVGTVIGNTSGFYRNDVLAGGHTFLPVLENPGYFTFSPATASAMFPTNASPFVQPFCLTANGTHNDLEIAMLPMEAARPGFNCKYKIIYKNKGTDAQSGSVNVNFNDAIIDYIFSNPVLSSQTPDNLNWNFTNLQPLETREILLTLKTNTPTQTPPVNAGNVLNFITTVTGLPDETTSDNTSVMNQIAVNSFDPNNKTCLEGTTVSTAFIGQYVHYIIRFENNGTANAENIVVKDVIDTSKFDISTLAPLSGSHTFFTRIQETNKVEFIFENINLPFDDANNDGYVCFKIKLKPTLAVGNTFSNNASIYFDYNAPIVTSTYTSTIQALGINNLVGNLISIYPNPVKDMVSFNTQERVIKVEIYEMAGRILSSNSVDENTLHLGYLQTGNYILKVYTENVITNIKIIKE